MQFGRIVAATTTDFNPWMLELYPFIVIINNSLCIVCILLLCWMSQQFAMNCNWMLNVWCRIPLARLNNEYVTNGNACLSLPERMLARIETKSIHMSTSTYAHHNDIAPAWNIFSTSEFFVLIHSEFQCIPQIFMFKKPTLTICNHCCCCCCCVPSKPGNANK